MIDFLWLVPVSPLIGVIINGFFGRRLPKNLIGIIACAVVGLSFIVAAGSVLELLKLPPDGRQINQVLYSWISTGGFKADFGLLLDPLSSVMILVVTGVGFLIHVYSVGYMHDDESYYRYFTYLNLFTASMLFLVIGNNFLLMFVGWEGVGLCSYLLIGFWFEKQSASDAGKKAFIVNRIGDFGFALGVMLIFTVFGTINFTEVFTKAPVMFKVGAEVVTVITLLLFVGAVGKSAQIPLYTWLPDAMEGPTPVSALIHAATMVTAGVYMVARCNPLYNLAPFSMNVVAVTGLLTAVFAASIGLVQNDIKRVLAYSTVSQLGYMFLACGVGAYVAGIFHLMTHAFFKALLFLGSGSVIHALGGEQDMRKMGALKNKIPVTHKTFLIGCLAIAGIPPFAGFFSKDEILWEAFSKGNPILWGVAVFAAFMTAFYMFRLLFMTFYGKSRMSHEVEHHVHESPKSMTIPLIILAVLSFFGGFVGLPLIPGLNKFHDFLGPVFGQHAAAEAHLDMSHAAIEIVFMVASVVVAVAGIMLARRIYIKKEGEADRLAEKNKTAYQILLNKYWVDEVYDYTIVEPIKNGSVWLWKKFDVLVIDGAVNGTANVVEWCSGVLRRFQTGYVYHYATYMFIGVLVILGYFFWQ